jgi:hypothetical protein
VRAVSHQIHFSPSAAAAACITDGCRPDIH